MLGQDAAYNGVVPDVGPIEWSTSNGLATIDGSGLLTAIGPGDTTVSARAGAWLASASVSIAARGVSVPTGLTATPLDRFAVRLSWQPSTSSVVGTLHYRLFRNGKAIGKRLTSTSFVDKHRKKKSRQFNYQVRAIDQAGDKSPKSAPITVRTVARSGSTPR